jgi:hypothetical protein
MISRQRPDGWPGAAIAIAGNAASTEHKQA